MIIFSFLLGAIIITAFGGTLILLELRMDLELWEIELGQSKSVLLEDLDVGALKLVARLFH